MEIPPELLKNLKCKSCNNYLSRGPIYLGHDGAAICGLCYSPNIPAIRNKEYETLIKLSRFPCKNRNLGCLENVPFVEDSEDISHEEVCLYRQHACPILDSSHCNWVGIKKDLLKHCWEQHGGTVKDNSVTLTHDITLSKEENYLLQAFGDLFLLHTKVSITSQNIYYAVRYLGMPKNANKFTFNIDIRRNDIKFSRQGFVTNSGCLVIQENISQVLNINSLLDILDGFEGTTFTITIKAIDQLSSVVEKCVTCGALISVLLYGTRDGYLCVHCIPDQEKCKSLAFGGPCNFTDISRKCEKHSTYFCVCGFCRNLKRISNFSMHFNEKHSKEYTTNPWIVMKKEGKVFLNLSGLTVICTYSFQNKKLTLNLFIPVKSDELFRFNCEVHITQLITKKARIYKPKLRCDTIPDWIVEVNPTHFPSLSYEFSVRVCLTKK